MKEARRRGICHEFLPAYQPFSAYLIQHFPHDRAAVHWCFHHILPCGNWVLVFLCLCDSTLSKALSLLGGNYFCSYLINYKCVWCLQHNKDVIWCERGKNRGSCWWWNTSREQFNFCTSNRIIRCPLPEHSQSLTASLLLLNWLILQSALWSTPRMNGRHWRDHQVSACKRCW